jgi:TonB family protein
MRYIVALTTVFTICMAASTVSPQEKQAPAQMNDAQLVAANKKPKNEVELVLENARKRGETIIHTCLENCDENPEANAVENEDFAKGRIVRLPKPSYPPLARLANVSGVVIVQVIIDLDGSIIAASVSTGHPLFHPACLQAARESLFTTSTLDGKPVKVTGVIRYTFTLPRTHETPPFP